MLRNVTILLAVFSLLIMGLVQAQNKPKINKTSKIISLTGDEVFPATHNPVVKIGKTTYPNVVEGDLTFDLVGTGSYSGYDAQSNGTTDELWQDPSNPDNLHAVFISSQETVGWSDRTVQYFLSFDGGGSWFPIATVPTTGERSGYPSINGFDDGTEIISLHSAVGGGLVRTAIFVDQSPGSGSFDFCDPGVGPVPTNPPIWPRVIGLGSNDYVFASSINAGPDEAYINAGDVSCNLSGYVTYAGDQAETYSLAYDEASGTIGHLYLGNLGTTDVFYRYSTDGTITWSDPDTLWAWTGAPDSLGCIRGCDLAFLHGKPVAVFEIGWTDPGGGFYGPDSPSSIYFWSPDVNGGQPMVIADSSMVPFYDNYNSATNDVMIPITRPTIGVSTGAMNNDAIFVSFLANTDQYLQVGTVANSYYAGWFTYSVDSGMTWTAPVKYTPVETPLRDWRYVSLSQNNAVVNDSVCTVHMVIQADTIPGSNVQVAAGYPVSLGAELVGVSTTITIPQHYANAVNDNKSKVYTFNLAQNYPNPFNPTTKISYTIPSRNNVSLKIYDMLGREVATLVNTTKDAGNYEVNFNASNLASGLYIYKLQAGNFVQSKKMLLLK
jgi:hypothetical protein